ncbi:MAG: sulfite exporter TauE/SafE family protein [Alphaproteobacteria bacterium]|nr:sulfite exporter TauE/SafE family protein [Alphaproteobacteria bacterium]
METFVILLVTSFFATLLSSMSGGGASAIIVPVMLWMGIPFPVAAAAQKVSATFWVLPASHNYLRDRDVDWRFLLGFAALGLVGVYVGYLIVISLDAHVVKRAVGSVILVLVAYTYFKRDLGLVKDHVCSPLRRAAAYVFAPVLGLYESFFGAGNGIVFSILAMHTRGFDFADALGYYYSIAFLWCLATLVLFISNGYYDMMVMIPTIVGSLAGGFLGSRYAKYKGNKFIKMMFVTIGGALGLKLVLGL